MPTPARLIALRVMPYDEGGYLETPEWKATAAAARLRADYRCERCQADLVRLEVHHLTYENRGCERLEDLRALCKPCHQAEHSETAKQPKVRSPRLIATLRELRDAGLLRIPIELPN